MNFVHLMNPYRQNILSIILSLVCVPFPLGSICKYSIFDNKDTTSFQIKSRSNKCGNLRYRKNLVVFVVDHSFRIKTGKIHHTILETFTKKNSLRNLTRFLVWFFELENLIFLNCRVLCLKTKKNLLKKDASHLKNACQLA